MGKELVAMVLKIAVALPVILFLIYAVLKYGGTNLQKMQNGRFLKVLERVPLSKDNSLIVVKMGGRSYVVSSTNHRIEILRELTEEEAGNLQEGKSIPEFRSLRDMYNNFKRKGR